MAEHNKYRFVHFRVNMTVRVPWDDGENPGEVYEQWRLRSLNIPDPEAAHGWHVELLNKPRTTPYEDR